MIISFAIFCAVLWILGVAFAYTVGGYIHLLLVLAVLALTYHFLKDSYSDHTHASGF